jgi:hypothetical protein
MTDEQWYMQCSFMHAMLQDEGNQRVKAELRRQMDIAAQHNGSLLCRLRKDPPENRYRWRPIAELHEDYGPCVLIDINEPGSMALGHKLGIWFDAEDWTHFTQITPLSKEEAEILKAGMAKSEEPA